MNVDAVAPLPIIEAAHEWGHLQNTPNLLTLELAMLKPDSKNSMPQAILMVCIPNKQEKWFWIILQFLFFSLFIPP